MCRQPLHNDLQHHPKPAEVQKHAEHVPTSPQRGVAAGRRLQCQEFSGNLHNRVLRGGNAQESDRCQQRGEKDDTHCRFGKDVGFDTIGQRECCNREGDDKQHPSDAGNVAVRDHKISAKEWHDHDRRAAGRKDTLHDGTAKAKHQTGRRNQVTQPGLFQSINGRHLHPLFRRCQVWPCENPEAPAPGTTAAQRCRNLQLLPRRHAARAYRRRKGDENGCSSEPITPFVVFLEKIV